MRVSFVLPTKNEEASVGAVVGGLAELSRSRAWQYEIIVADDSTDRTAARAEALGARVVAGGGVGLGQAMIRGIAAALKSDPDWIVTLDADGQVDLSEIPAFFEAATSEGADVVISSRFLARNSIDYRYPWVNWLGNRILVGILRLATGYRFTDSHGGIRLMRVEAVKNLKLVGRHTYVQETLVQLHRQGFRIVELPSRWQERRAGNSRVVRSIWRYALRTLPALLYWLKAHYLAALLAVALAAELLALGSSPLVSGIAIAGLAFFLSSLVWISRNALRVAHEERD